MKQCVDKFFTNLEKNTLENAWNTDSDKREEKGADVKLSAEDKIFYANWMLTS